MTFRVLSLTRGLVTKLDEEDYQWASKEKWNVSGCGKPGVYYASKMVNLGKVNGKSKYKKRTLHREIVRCPAGLQVDHINGDTLDNRKVNLRIVTHSQNAKNRAPNKGKSYKGIHQLKSSGKWQVRVTCNGSSDNLGTFKTFEEALSMRLHKERELFGEYMR